MASTVGSSNSKSGPMIRLAPSPRDPPAAKLSSPRSFRSQASSSQQQNISGSERTKRIGSSPRASTTKQRNRVEATMTSAFFGGAAMAMEDGPEMDATEDVFSTKKLASRPRSSSMSNNNKAAHAHKSNKNLNTSTETNELNISGVTDKATGGNHSTLDPPALSPASASASASASNTRSKKILVIDPSSGKKYHLHPDDHSLTDKELHVYHKSKSNSSRKSRRSTATSAAATDGNQHKRSLSDGAGSIYTQTTKESESPTLNTFGTDMQYSLGDTLETASALTECEYGHGKKYRLKSMGPLSCFLPTSCRSVEHLALKGGIHDLLHNGIIEEADVVVEGRDDVESVERGRYKHLLEETGTTAKGTKRLSKIDTTASNSNKSVHNGSKYDDANNKVDSVGNHLSKKKNGEDDENELPALLSPITALGGIVSPRISSLAKSFFDNNTKFNVPEGSEVIEVKFRRVTLVVFPDEVQSCLHGKMTHGKYGRVKTMGLMGMTFCQNEDDFQAHVNYVQRGSKADRMGVRKGDIVSFAVALSNMTEEQNSFLAAKLIKRLESVGMRTSYRELYDIFLSKTTNARPIGMVFRRWKNRGAVSSASPRNIRITNEFEWSTNFLQSLSIKCREYEFDQKVPLAAVGAQEQENNNGAELPKLSFLPEPNVETTPSTNVVSDYLTSMFDSFAMRYNCASDMPVMNCIDATFGADSNNKQASAQGKKTGGNYGGFLSNRTLCSLVEQSMGLIFLRRVSSQTDASGAKRVALGSGFVVTRKAEGSWSAPCFLSVLGSKDSFTEKQGDLSPGTDDVKVIVIRKKELVNNLVLGNAVKFTVRKEERANVLVRDSAIIGVQEGRFQLEPNEFFLAVKVNDIQNQGAYSMSTDYIEASDILTGTVSPPEQSVDFYGALQSLELPYSMHSHPVIPEMLLQYSESDWVEFLPDQQSAGASKLETIAKKSSLEDKREIEIFARKFKYYLMDGVPVQRVLSSNNSGMAEEKVLRLTIKDPNSLFSSSLELSRKRRPGVNNVGIPSNFSTTFENITKLSRTPPASLTNLDEEEKKRFFSFETDLSPGPVMVLAKSKKDAMILLCGLKLLLEKEKMASSE